MNSSKLDTHNRSFFCNNCQSKTHHKYVASATREWNVDDEEGYGHFIISIMWVCLGCDTPLLEESLVALGLDKDRNPPTDIDFNSLFASDDEIYFSKLIPERTLFQVQEKSFRQLPDRLANIYHETMHAYNNNLDVLCSIGIRTLIEGICADQEIGGKNLQSKIDGLVSVLPKNIVTNLHNLRFMGNEAAHELQVSDRADLRLAIEICEDLLNFLYELDYRASQLAISRQNRKLDDNNTNSLTNEDNSG